jgi:D-alanyl-D-alanine carboxypeptidase/D-alanyl-D-alanine carboxypeptidase (penicillin-binding protein 5/6)
MFHTVDAAAQPVAPEAGSYILIDSETGDILCKKDAQERMYPASTTKIMTAILALEKGDLEQEMTASQAAIDDIGPDGSNIGIIAGEKISLKNLLEALLISSANESANIIAENLTPNRGEFISMMNSKARELGATNTHFANTNGFHDPDHYTSASDLAKFARYAMTFPKFREIVSTRSYKMPATNKHTDWPVLSNTNKLMISDKNDLYEIDGIKTGYTGPAGFNLVSSAKDKNGMELISVVMGVKNDDAQENVKKYSKELLDYGFNNFKKVDLMEKGKVYRNVKVADAMDIYGLDLVAADSLTCVLPKAEEQQNIKEIPHIRDEIAAPVNKGDIIGYVEYKKGDVSIGKIDLIAGRSIEQKPVPITAVNKLKSLTGSLYAKIGLTIIGLVVFFIILRKVLRHISRRVNSRRYY